MYLSFLFVMLEKSHKYKKQHNQFKVTGDSFIIHKLEYY